MIYFTVFVMVSQWVRFNYLAVKKEPENIQTPQTADKAAGSELTL